MTYTYKLARRLAISRTFSMLATLALVSACAGGDSTAPETLQSQTSTPASLSVLPHRVTIETNQAIRFRGATKSSRGEYLTLQVRWTTTGGRITGDGTFAATEPGRYKIFGRGRGRHGIDTSTVEVVPPQPTLKSLAITPDADTVAAGGSQAFIVKGTLSDGSPVPVGVVWSATGGTIDPSGVYTAGASTGVYRVIAANTVGTVADTAPVRVVAAPVVTVPVDSVVVPAPVDTVTTPPLDTTTVPVVPAPVPPAPDTTPAPPPPAPLPTLASVVLTPTSVSLTSGSSKQFVVYGRLSNGDSVPVTVAWVATGGTVTSKGLYTAGASGGAFRVTAASGALAGTANVTVSVPPAPTAANSTGGIPFGAFHVPDDQYAVRSWYTGSMRALYPSSAAATLAAARARGFRMIVSLPDSRNNYTNPDRTFNLAMWKLQMDKWKPYASLLASYYASGTIIGNYLVDEPHCTGCWGGKTISYADIAEMTRYAKSILPTIPTVIRIHPGWLRASGRTFPDLDVAWAQYEGRLHKPSYGMSPEQWRDKNIADAQAIGVSLVMGMNTLDGGDGSSGLNGTMIDPTRWQMSAAEVERAGKVFAASPSVCAVLNWRFSSTMNQGAYTTAQWDVIRQFDDRTDVKTALANVAAVARSRTATPCN